MHLSADALLCMGVVNAHLSFRVALVMSALAMDITIWGKLGESGGGTINILKNCQKAG